MALLDFFSDADFLSGWTHNAEENVYALEAAGYGVYVSPRPNTNRLYITVKREANGNTQELQFATRAQTAKHARWISEVVARGLQAFVQANAVGNTFRDTDFLSGWNINQAQRRATMSVAGFGILISFPDDDDFTTITVRRTINNVNHDLKCYTQMGPRHAQHVAEIVGRGLHAMLSAKGVI